MPDEDPTPAGRIRVLPMPAAGAAAPRDADLMLGGRRDGRAATHPGARPVELPLRSLPGTSEDDAGAQSTGRGLAGPAEALVNENVFYFEGRRRRRVYDSRELQATVVYVAIRLLLRSRGLLDERYVSLFPVNDGKENIPFLLGAQLASSLLPPNQPDLCRVLQKSKIEEMRLRTLFCARRRSSGLEKHVSNTARPSTMSFSIADSNPTFESSIAS